MQEALEILKKISTLVVEDDEMARELIISGLKPYCEQVVGRKTDKRAWRNLKNKALTS